MSVKKEKTALDEESLRFLRRGEPSPAPREQDLAVGPSVIFDEESGRAIAIERSPPPSQMLSTQQQNFEALASSAARLPRQRPRFHNVQDLDLALNQAIEGKITSKNAWLSKEASDLLEGITHTIQNTLDASATADDYAGFAKAATVVEGCSKVWTSRVDSTHQQSNLMVQRLLRNDESDRGGAAGLDGAADGADGAAGGQADGRRRKGVHGRAGAAGASRTLALDAAEINLDGKSKTALTQGGMNAQFRAITEKFDQGNAQGLLLNNAPQGMRGNLILDVDYARGDGATSASLAGGTGSSRAQRKAAGTMKKELTHDAHNEEEADDADTDGVVGGQPRGHPGGRLSHALRHLAEDDAFMDVDEAQLSLPAYEPRALTASGLLSTRNSVRLSQVNTSHITGTRGSGSAGGGDDVSAETVATVETANAVESLLMVPHTNSPFAAGEASPSALNLRASDPAAQRLFAHSDSAHAGDADDGDNNDWGDADDGMAGGGFDDNDDFGADDDTDGTHHETSVAAELIMSGADIGTAARAMMTGTAAVDAMDAFLGTTGTVQQLALEADDPSAWCPLSQVAPASAPHAALSGGLPPHSELSKLRKAHRFGPAAGVTADAAEGSALSGGTAGLLKHVPETAAKSAGRKQKSVVFDLPVDAGETARTDSTGVFVLDRQEINQSALKPSQTATKNVTPLGRELVLGKDAERAVLAYVQSGFQRTKAEQMNLLLPDVPQPGTTMPAYLPYPVQVSHFFQPFSTTQPEWNLLRKSASGQVLDMRTGAAAGAPGASVLRGARGSGGSNSSVFHNHASTGEDGVDDRDDMPVEFFPGGAEHEDDDGFDDGGYDAFGPDDDGNDPYDAEIHAANEALRSERFLMAQFNAQQASAAAAAAGWASGRPSSSDVSGARPSYAGDLVELAKVLNAPEATIPNQVDVVQLRMTMWEALQHHMAINPLIPSSVHWDGALHNASNAKDNESDDERDEEGGVARRHQMDERMQQRDPNAPMLKKHAQRVLGTSHAQKRTRTDAHDGKDDKEPHDEEEEEKEEGDKDAATPRRPPQKKRAVGDTRTSKQTVAQPGKHYELGLAHTSSSSDNESDAESEAEDEANRAQKTTPASGKKSKRGALPHFSHVVRSVLPEVPTISSTGTLSPAFFFFSILFLANEHNVVLDNVTSLDDLIVRGVARGVSAGDH